MSGEITEDHRSPEDIVSPFIGEHILLPAINFLSRRVDTFDIDATGLENLQLFKSVPALYVSNHLQPVEFIPAKFHVGPDPFVIQHVVREAIGVSPRIVAKAGDGWWSGNPIHRKFQEKSYPFIRKAMDSAGLIPINKYPNSQFTDFNNAIGQAVRKGDSILMFPEGHKFQDFSPDHKLGLGAAYLATQYELPIIPVYIHGAIMWKKGQHVDISFGKPFMAVKEGRDGRRKTTEMIREALTELQKESLSTRSFHH